MRWILIKSEWLYCVWWHVRQPKRRFWSFLLISLCKQFKFDVIKKNPLSHYLTFIQILEELCILKTGQWKNSRSFLAGPYLVLRCSARIQTYSHKTLSSLKQQDGCVLESFNPPVFRKQILQISEDGSRWLCHALSGSVSWAVLIGWGFHYRRPSLVSHFFSLHFSVCM